MSLSPLDHHAATPREIQDRIAAERRGMPFLVYRDGDSQQVLVELGGDPERLTIGRRANNDIALGWDEEVSRVHAEVERVGSDWVVNDDGMSHNGTWVNGERVIARRRLEDGDVIAIGGTLIAYCAPGELSTLGSTVTAGRSVVPAELTRAQQRVLIALCRPYRDSAYAAPSTNHQIADELVVSVDAVKSTLRQLFELFGVDQLPQNQKRAALALRAIQTGVISRRDL